MTWNVSHFHNLSFIKGIKLLWRNPDQINICNTAVGSKPFSLWCDGNTISCQDPRSSQTSLSSEISDIKGLRMGRCWDSRTLPSSVMSSSHGQFLFACHNCSALNYLGAKFTWEAEHIFLGMKEILSGTILFLDLILNCFLNGALSSLLPNTVCLPMIYLLSHWFQATKVIYSWVYVMHTA